MFNDARQIYAELLTQLRTNNINFQLRGRIHASEASLGGHFFLLHDTLPTIELFRNSVPFQIGRLTDSDIAKIVDTAGGDLEQEAVTLAHEYGHYKSFVEGCRGTEYVAVSNRFHAGEALNPCESRIIFEEEDRAWTNAKAILNELGYGNPVFLQQRISGAETEYRRRLPNLDPLVMQFATTTARER